MHLRLALAVAASAIVGVALLDSPARGEQAASQENTVAQGFLDAGFAHTCAVLESGAVRCWGEGDLGRLGLENTNDIGDDEFPDTVATVRLPADARAIAAGFTHTCALLEDRTVRCWGDGLAGRLGYGNSSNVGDVVGQMPPPPVAIGGDAVAIMAGGTHTCAILTDGTVRCWGGGSEGRLGYGNTNNIGDAPGEMPPPPVPLGGSAVAISAGTRHTCAILEDATLRCWGAAASGELGNGSAVENIGDAPGEMPPPPVLVGGLAVAISAGFAQTCAILADENARCWGEGSSGQLGYGNTDDIGDQVGEMPPGGVPLGGSVRSISTGHDHTCAIVGLSTKCWGSSAFGQLGYGSVAAIGDGPLEMPPETVATGQFSTRAIGAGDFHTCAVLGSGGVRCWGAGGSGRLGYRSSTNIGDNAGETPGTVPEVPLGDAITTVVADLSLSLAPSASTAVVGEQLNLDVTVVSAGPRDGLGIIVGLTLPRGLSYLSGPMDPASGLISVGSAQDSGDPETRTIAVRVTDPGVLPVTAQIVGADTFDPDSTPGGGPAGEDDQASTSIASSAAKVQPDALFLTASPGRDRKLPIRFTVSGRLAVGAGVAAVCAGEVGLTVKARAKQVASKKAMLGLSSGECSYRASFAFRKRRAIGTRTRALTVTASFPGNSLALPMAAKPATVKVR